MECGAMVDSEKVGWGDEGGKGNARIAETVKDGSWCVEDVA
jgi:hypothetical protein